MGLTKLEDLLEHPDQAPFYDLMGGLADNLLTIGPYAGTFLACSACGETFTLKGESWKCECCGQGYELKFKPSDQRGTPFETMVKVTGLTKPRWNPHWYYDNENWSVAEFLTQVLRLQAESFLGPWFWQLGVPIDRDSALETVLCWPRFRFGRKTIQPDMAVGFQREIVFVEFKRPAGGTTPPVNLMGLLCFAAAASQRLSRQWHIVLVPGRDSTLRTSTDYIHEALAAASEAQSKWAIPQSTMAGIQSSQPVELAGRLRVIGWESLLRLSTATIQANVPDSWTRQQALTKLRFFHAKRAALGLFAPLAGE